MKFFSSIHNRVSKCSIRGGEDIGTILSGKHDIRVDNFKAICDAVEKVFLQIVLKISNYYFKYLLTVRQEA